MLKWCELRLAMDEFARKKSIVMSVMSLLEQVGKHQVNGAKDTEQPHASVYESNVMYKEGRLIPSSGG